MQPNLPNLDHNAATLTTSNHLKTIGANEETFSPMNISEQAKKRTVVLAPETPTKEGVSAET